MKSTSRIQVSCESPDLVSSPVISDFEKYPERRLWCEVIFRAYHDVQEYLKEQKYSRYHNAISAQQWILHPSEDKFSFIWATRVSFSAAYIADAIIEKIRTFTPKSLPMYTERSYRRQRTIDNDSRRRARRYREQSHIDSNLATKIVELEFFPPHKDYLQAQGPDTTSIPAELLPLIDRLIGFQEDTL